MQILIVLLIVLTIILYLIYKIKKTFSKKELSITAVIIVLIIIASIFYNKTQDDKLPQAFKAKYLKDKNIEILKLSIDEVGVEDLSSNRSVYDFSYIIQKDTYEYVCLIKNIKVQIIEDEYIFDEINEKCRKK